MGTRGMTLVIVNGETKIAQYSQWDNYPEGQGTTAFRFLQNSKLVDALREKAPLLREANDEDLARVSLEANVPADKQWVNLEEADRLKKAAPHLDRDMGSKILEFVARGLTDFVRTEPEFIEDAVYCEGVFEVNLDENTFSYWSPCYEKHDAALVGQKLVLKFEDIQSGAVTVEDFISRGDALYAEDEDED